MPASLVALWRRRRPQLSVLGQLARRFRAWGLSDPESVFNLPGQVISGHADRHVVRVVVGRGSRRIVGYLKREHRIRWRDRLRAWWDGFGPVSLAEREMQILSALRRAGVPVPPVLASGTTGGRAFLLLGAIRGSIDLRRFLHRAGAAVPEPRRAAAARRLGAILGDVHNAGVDAPDLLSKHILVHPQTLALALLDWPRARRWRIITVDRAARDLGQLDASLSPLLATPLDRLRCLRAYWRERGGSRFYPFRWLVLLTQRSAKAALRKRSVRDLLRPPSLECRQHLRWLDGEQLCVTESFWHACRRQPPPWLAAAAKSRPTALRTDCFLWHGRQVALTRWPAASIVGRTLARLVGRRVVSPRTRQAGVIFRLQRYGIRAPRVLAFGRRPDGSGFLLTRPVLAAQPFAHWVMRYPGRRGVALARFGRSIQKLHAAGQRLGRRTDALVIGRQGRIVLGDPAALSPLPRSEGRWPLRDLATIIRAMRLDRTDAARLVCGYLGQGATVDEGRALADALQGGRPHG